METSKILANKTLLSAAEEKRIRQKIDFVLIDKQFHVLRNASVASIIIAILPVWGLHGYLNTLLLYGWYTSMFVVHVVAIAFANYYLKIQPTMAQITPWAYALRVATLLSTLSYGSMGFLLVPDNPERQVLVLFFLVIVSSAITLGTSADYLISVISIGSTLLPFIVWHIYAMLHNIPGSHSQIAGTLFVYMAFLFAISYISYRLVRKSSELSFINEALSEKLQEANVILEQKVQERTQELREALEKVIFQSTHDILTGLPNQESFYDFLRVEIEKAEQDHYEFGIACFSINQAELLINTFGYKIWTSIIKTVADRLAEFCDGQINIRSVSYKLALTRRDVFAIIISPLRGEEEREKVTNLFSILMENPLTIEGQEITLTASIGASIYPKDATAAEILLTCADATMYDSKKMKSADDNLLFYKPSVNAMGPRTIKLLNLLVKAFYNQEFKLLYQPIVSLNTGYICALEALSRWTNTDIGFISPEEFIPLIQNSKISMDYDQWVLRAACTQLKYWHELGFQDLKVSVNLSEEFLRHADMAKTVKQLLEQVGLRKDALEIEFLENIAFEQSLLPNFLELRNMGVNISVDDYGKGQGDLEKIKAIPFTKLKIDKEFIQALTLNERNAHIVKSAIDLAKRMGAKVVAEGVETIEQLEFLRQNDCDMVQGYLFSKPVSVDDITQQLKEKKNINGMLKS